MPEFSVVICTHNRAPIVCDAIRSVLDQTFADLQLVVVDDGSTDDTAAVVGAIADERLVYVRQENAGLSAARNTGVARSSGRLVTFLDDDDEALPDWLASLHPALAGGPAVACCGGVVTDDRGRMIREVRPNPLGPVFEDYTGLFLAGTFALHREIYEAAGGFAPELQCSHHTGFALRLLPLCRARGWPVRAVDKPLVRHVQRAADRRRPPRKLRDAAAYLLERHGTQLARVPRIHGDYCAIAGVAAARLSDWKGARAWLRAAMRADPGNWRHRMRWGLTYLPGLRNLVWHTARYRDAGAG